MHVVIDNTGQGFQNTYKTDFKDFLQQSIIITLISFYLIHIKLIFLKNEVYFKPVRMRAYPVIVLEMGTRHGHQVSRPLAPTNQTGR